MTDPDPIVVARDLMRRLGEIDKLFDRQEQERDYSEKLGAAALEAAEGARITVRQVAKLTRRIVVLLACGLLIWTPFVAYGAVWAHELVRNSCYPVGTAAMEHIPEPWFCGVFPGTNHPHH